VKPRPAVFLLALFLVAASLGIVGLFPNPWSQRTAGGNIARTGVTNSSCASNRTAMVSRGEVQRDDTVAACDKHASSHGNSPEGETDSPSQEPVSPVLTPASRDVLRKLEFLPASDSYSAARASARAHFGFDSWPSSGIGLKAGFKFQCGSFPVLSGYDEVVLPSSLDFDFQQIGGSERNGVFWGLSGHKMGVQRWFALSGSTERIYVSVFVGDAPHDAHVHLIDCAAAWCSSRETEVFRFYARDQLRIGDVSLSAGLRDTGYSRILFVRANVFVGLDISLNGPNAGLDLAILASEIDAAILKLPDVTEDEMAAMRPKFVSCKPGFTPLIASHDLIEPKRSTRVTCEAHDPRDGRIFYCPGRGGPHFGFGGDYTFKENEIVVSVVGDCPEGDHSVYFTAINDHLLFSVYEFKMPVRLKR
jgi:hypothetical protein